MTERIRTKKQTQAYLNAPEPNSHKDRTSITKAKKRSWIVPSLNRNILFPFMSACKCSSLGGSKNFRAPLWKTLFRQVLQRTNTVPPRTVLTNSVTIPFSDTKNAEKTAQRLTSLQQCQLFPHWLLHCHFARLQTVSKTRSQKTFSTQANISSTASRRDGANGDGCES